ncbi:pyrimidine-nucleoside phosphorylase/thymidine phosphorylase [Deinobacterium chartae]|uniref:Pyrimidine-nucleoside phosphorylase/thymidine phosphorylase n=1 Tax=Deinobacterium chartae TaxID=521158 RepID=A0A841I680_9DEIO|nr:thymidine phosphorylase [Deinobacterium chartae]MBB6099930.1 pyrimidine-nucleoside phosphorylase/thymidine phosphorylase [Deinobacterium chartae]
MRVPDLIEKKRDGLEHSAGEIRFLVSGYTAGEIPDYQIAAWLMAVYLRGMTARETAALTQAMAESGDLLDLSSLERTVDKHSTGGVGDKTSLVLTPMLAALGLTVAKMSGRGLAHTGGTIDKLESIPGWSPELDDTAFLRQAREIGLALVGQSKNLAPADGLLYALRDVTATVDSIPLIASSIMSKKLASGAHTIVLDVKVGAGAFMKDLESGRRLARAMVEIGQHSGRNVRALLTDMDTPLGHMAGNSLEVIEALATLRGEGPQDLLELCLELAREALLAYGFSEDEARARPLEVIRSGAALAKFRDFVAAQGGDPGYVDDVSKFNVAEGRLEVRASHGGYLVELDALEVGRAVLALGGGRERKGEPIDHGVGVEVLKKVGERVQTGDVLARVYHREGRGLETAEMMLARALKVGEEAVKAPPLVLDRVF